MSDLSYIQDPSEIGGMQFADITKMNQYETEYNNCRFVVVGLTVHGGAEHI